MSSHYLDAADDCPVVTSFVAQIDIISTYGIQAKGLFVENAGAGTRVLEIITSAGQTRTLTVTTGEEIPVKTRAITTNTTIASLRVYI